MNKSDRARPSCMTVLICLAITGSGTLSVAAEPATAPHGAMPMQEQQKRLDQLVTRFTTPSGIDPVAWATIYMLAGNELTPDRVALGRKLYFDTRLSKDGTLACATCHDVSRGFTDRRSVSEGIGDHLGKRSAPTTMNAALLESMFWDGRAASLEEQAKLPILNPIEMGHLDAASAITAIKADLGYQSLFQKAYGHAPNYDDLGRAIASFERTLIFFLTRRSIDLPAATARHSRPPRNVAWSYLTARRAVSAAT